MKHGPIRIRLTFLWVTGMFVTYGTPYQICETSLSHIFARDVAAFWALPVNPGYAPSWLQQMKMNASRTTGL